MLLLSDSRGNAGESGVRLGAAGGARNSQVRTKRGQQRTRAASTASRTEIQSEEVAAHALVEIRRVQNELPLVARRHLDCTTKCL